MSLGWCSASDVLNGQISLETLTSSGMLETVDDSHRLVDGMLPESIELNRSIQFIGSDSLMAGWDRSISLQKGG